MMKWGRKNHVFSLSWFSRFKKTSDGTEQDLASTKGVEKKKTSSHPRRPSSSSWTEGRFHGGVDESYWRLSFGEDQQLGGVLKSVRYNSDDELQDCCLSPQGSSQRNVKIKPREIAGRRKISEVPRHVEILQINDYSGEGEKETEKHKRLRGRASKDIKFKKLQQGVLEDECLELPRELHAAKENCLKSMEKENFELEPVKIIQTEKDYQKSAALKCGSSISNSSLRTTGEDCALETLQIEQVNELSNEEFFIPEGQELKIKRIMAKSEEQKKSAVGCTESPRKRRKQSRKVRVYTPRTAARIECKIRALEDLKKAKTKTKNVRKEKAAKEATPFDSFAVVKSSHDPQQDFKNSMAEMIIANGIRQPQELEELLACYLTLNCDEYHELIIKVFRQVWVDLKQVHF